MSRLAQAFQRASSKDPRGSGQDSSRAHPSPVLALESALATYPSEAPRIESPSLPLAEVTNQPSQRESIDPPLVLSAAAAVPISVGRHLDGKVLGTPAMAADATEGYRRIAAGLEQVRRIKQFRTVLISSAERGEGRTLTAVNLALTLAERAAGRVLLVDGDLRSPSIHTIFQLSNATGLSELLASSDGHAPIVEVGPKLSILPAGRPAADPITALVSARMRGLLLEAATTFEWVIVDSSAVNDLEDSHLLAWLCDGALFVVAAEHTRTSTVLDAIATLGGDRVVGAVLNRCHGRF